MGEEYRAKIFKSGNSLALRLPKALGLKDGAEMVVREEGGRYAFEPVTPEPKNIDLTGIWGAVPGLTAVERVDFEPRELDWEGKLSRRD